MFWQLDSGAWSLSGGGDPDLTAMALIALARYRQQKDVQAAVDRVEQQMSTWRADSDLERLNAAPVGQWMPVPKALMAVLTTALEIGRLSEGAFDIGVALGGEAVPAGTVTCSRVSPMSIDRTLITP